jgi:hypothetical protein
MSDLDLLHFPSGRSVGNCRKDAKRLSREKLIPLGQAQDTVAQNNGLAMPWGKAMAELQASPPSKPGDDLKPSRILLRLRRQSRQISATLRPISQ